MGNCCSTKEKKANNYSCIGATPNVPPINIYQLAKFFKIY